jgi:hypothetical protein
MTEPIKFPLVRERVRKQYLPFVKFIELGWVNDWLNAQNSELERPVFTSRKLPISSSVPSVNEAGDSVI